MHNLGLVRRSLAERRQRLGILPTLSFWNCGEQQRLLMPISLLVALPIGALFVVSAAIGGRSGGRWRIASSTRSC